jgi:predicted DCC family thiol-disulfide oxidoreductase YuxK
MPANEALVLYDGVCGLCNRTVRFILRRDKRHVFRFAPLQSPLGEALLRAHGHDPRELQTVYLVLDRGEPSERLLSRSAAAQEICRQLGGVWRLCAAFKVLPRRWRDALYDFVARHRYRWFGKYETCPLPTPEERERFVE